MNFSLSRRDLVVATASLALLAVPQMAPAQEGAVHVYSGSDSNITDFWRNVIVPGFNEEHPDATIEIVDAGDNSGLRSIAERAMAALGTDQDPQAELFEAFVPAQIDGSIEAGLWTDFTEAGLDGLDRLNPAAIQTAYDLPYRGSQVLLAYDSSRVAEEDVPHTWDELVAWIEENPGQFIYNRPDQGGSGGNFVRRAIHQVNGLDPSAFTLDNYSEDYAQETLTPAWDLLNELEPNLYNSGAYTSGNTQSIQLLAQGVVTMTPVWSDQVLQAIEQGVLPEDTGLVQLQDLALAGGFSRMTIPTNAAQHEQAMELASYMLSDKVQSQIITELGGFPAVSWDHVDEELREKYADVIPQSIPTFPAGDWDAAINDGWYRNVAPDVARQN